MRMLRAAAWPCRVAVAATVFAFALGNTQVRAAGTAYGVDTAEGSEVGTCEIESLACR